MKKLLLFGAIALTSITFAQANLQFSQVILVGSSIQTIPENKVWKIESISYTQGLSHLPSGNFTTTNTININSITSVVRSVCGIVSNGPAYGVWEQQLPMWLPSGTTLSAGSGVTNISVLEFNLVP